MPNDPIAQNIVGVEDLISSGTNKINNSAASEIEGITGEKVDVLELDLDDEELLKLSRQWSDQYAGYEATLTKKTRANKKYYLGKQWEGTQYYNDFPLAGNLIFEAEETFLPAALSKNPEPVVYSDNTTEGNKIASDLKTMLQYHADDLDLRSKLATVVRQWSIYHLGVLKYGWDKKRNDVSIETRKVQDFVFDIHGTVDAKGHFDSFLGERITISAERLIELFPEHKSYITILVEGRMGTEVTYTEWWTDEYCFSTFKDVVLDKHKNEFYKYPEDQEQDALGGAPQQPQVTNHFAQPMKPYTFLSVFSLGEQPHDITGLIEQNIPNQNLITRNIFQIDKNVSNQNNFIAFSEDNFNQETAKAANNASSVGNGILVPKGVPIDQAIVRFPVEALPSSFFDNLAQNKDALRTSFGTNNISSTPSNPDVTARGEILAEQKDNTRIQGGIGDALERVAKSNFNWLTQLYYVFYDESHFGAVMGALEATEYVILSSQDLSRKVIVTVAPDSMKPHDEITEMNQALALWASEPKGIDLKTLLTILRFPDPNETAAQAWLYQNNPQVYAMMNFPEMMQEVQQIMAGQAPGGQPGAPGGGGQPPAPGGAPGDGAPGQVQPGQPPTTGGVPTNASLSQVPLK